MINAGGPFGMSGRRIRELNSHLQVNRVKHGTVIKSLMKSQLEDGGLTGSRRAPLVGMARYVLRNLDVTTHM